MARFNSTLPKAQCAAKRSTLKNAFCRCLNKLCFQGVDSAYPSLACHLTRTFNYTPAIRVHKSKMASRRIRLCQGVLLVTLEPDNSVADVRNRLALAVVFHGV